MNLRRRLAIAVVIAAALLIVGRAVTGVYVDYQWYAALGAVDVWRAKFYNSAQLRLVSGTIATLFVFANLYAVRHSVVSLVLPRRLANLEIGEEIPGRMLLIVAAVMSALAGSALSIPGDAWPAYVLARQGRPFGEGDPYFQHDLGFFVYWLPFERTLYVASVLAVAVVVLIVVVLYALTPSLRVTAGRVYVSTYVRRHLTVLGGVLLLLLAWSFRLDMYRLLSDGSGEGGAFTFIDHRVAIPGNLILAVVTLGAALVVVWAGWTGQIRLAFFAVTAVLGLALVTKQLAPIMARQMSGDAEIAARDRPYATTRALYARRAYAVDRVATDTSMAFTSLTELARNVAIWDGPTILRVLQRARPGRAFANAVGWRSTSGGVTAIVAERAATVVRDNAVHWTIQRVLATAADDRGGVVTIGDGTLLAGPAVVHDTTTPPLLLADATGQVAGARLDGSAVRLAHAWALQDARLLWGDLPSAAPVLIVRRSVRERVSALVPFLAQGTTVAPVVVDDSLYWTLDLYSASEYYPLSDVISLRDRDVTYLRHAAVAVVNAATGRVRVVADTVLDPIAATWRARFPTLFVDWRMLARGLREQIPPAADALAAQGLAFARYIDAARTPAVRRLPLHLGADTALGGARPVFVLPRGGGVAIGAPVLDEADDIAGLLVATAGAPFQTRWYPTGGPARRWTSVLRQLRPEDTRATSEGPLVRGPIRTIPAFGSLAFVQPTYVWPTEDGPRLAHTSLLVGDSVRTAPTLQAVIDGRSGGVASPAINLRGTIQRLYDAMRRAARDGDWPAFGRAFDSIGIVLRNRP